MTCTACHRYPVTEGSRDFPANLCEHCLSVRWQHEESGRLVRASTYHTARAGEPS